LKVVNHLKVSTINISYVPLLVHMIALMRIKIRKHAF